MGLFSNLTNKNIPRKFRELDLYIFLYVMNVFPMSMTTEILLYILCFSNYLISCWDYPCLIIINGRIAREARDLGLDSWLVSLTVNSKSIQEYNAYERPLFRFNLSFLHQY